jgi:phosphate uptake regulator
MVFKFLRGEGGERLERIESKVQTMLALDRQEFDLAMSALLGEISATEVNPEVRSRDRKVNELEREIRRDLLVHASVFGGIDSPAVLIYMSVVKDVERVGDYAKNLLDLGRDGADLSSAPDAEEWRRLAREISRFIGEVGEAFHARDGERSRVLRHQGDRLLRLFDARVSALIREEDAGAQAVSRALAHRYLKRVVAHLMNLLSAVIMPMDQLDYFDEDPEDRGGG